jgi:alanine racemase
LVGPNNDAHAYIEDLIATGAKLCGVTYSEGCADKANFLIVENTLAALQHFAAYYRSLFIFP